MVLKKLIETGYTLGLWSNTPWQSPGYMSEDLMNKMQIRHYFSTVQFSGDHENRKPNPETMEIIRNILACKKEQMIYIGNAEVDIQTGINYGIPTIWINRNDEKITKNGPIPNLSIKNLTSILDFLPFEN